MNPDMYKEEMERQLQEWMHFIFLTNLEEKNRLARIFHSMISRAALFVTDLKTTLKCRRLMTGRRGSRA
jgi:hypothetical protein